MLHTKLFRQFILLITLKAQRQRQIYFHILTNKQNLNINLTTTNTSCHEFWKKFKEEHLNGIVQTFIVTICIVLFASHICINEWTNNTENLIFLLKIHAWRPNNYVFAYWHWTNMFYNKLLFTHCRNQTWQLIIFIAAVLSWLTWKLHTICELT